MLANDFRRRLIAVLSCPTAPFHEGRVHAVIRAAVRASPHLRDRVDAYGNLEVVYGPGRPKLLFTCHTDHPALRANGDGTALIVGGIRPPALVRCGLTDFEGNRVATVSKVVRDDRPFATVKLRGGKRLKRGAPLLLDLPGVRLGGGKIRAPAVDDLCAVAACLTMFDRLAAARWRGTVGVLFTRAEEVGFVGALGWTRTTRYPRATTLVNLEMSPALRHTPLGAGPILRVGDRMTTFRQGLAIELEAAAKELAKKTKGFRYQRALMDGGACEATAYTFAGFRAGALCLPLKNYHNHARGGGMGLEYVDQSDAGNLVRWMVAFARRIGKLDPRHDAESRLAKLWRMHAKRLERTAAEGQGDA